MKKKLKKKIKLLEAEISALSYRVDLFSCRCQNYKPRTLVRYKDGQPAQVIKEETYEEEDL